MNFVEKDGYTLIEMPTYLSAEVIEETERNFSSVIQKEGSQFVLDMEKVQHLFSSGVRLITSLNKVVTEKKGKLALVNVTEDVEKALRSINLDKIISIYNSIIDFEIERETA